MANYKRNKDGLCKYTGLQGKCGVQIELYYWYKWPVDLVLSVFPGYLPELLL